ncbi:MAG: prephenate dehydrogenase [Blautia sp.]|nr:prephenate dehydrogenase [Lachnoclostridium sp.]MCM1211275.1 prephenate dehydrogenase [Blautia sp.]
MAAFTCGFIGLGLIGGSLAKAIHHKIPQARLIAYDTNSDALDMALSESVIQKACSHIGKAFADCDYIFLCAPVSHNDENLLALKNFLSPDAVLTDVGSVKTGIHKHIAALGLDHQFIGGHPMTGSERFGYANSKASLFENAYYILTPTDKTSAEKISAYQTLVQTIGAIPLVLSYAQHDYVTAAISHLPHVIAASLVNLVKNADSKEGIMKMIAAGGFKDITRIASSSPAMWQQICQSNTENISLLLEQYIRDLTTFKQELDKQDTDTLYQFFDTARIYRESFIDASSGPIKTEYVITVDIADKPGAIAAIASLLAMHDVSIKNIGINHNRELAEGALRIEFYEDTALDNATKVLKEHGYGIHTKFS